MAFLVVFFDDAAFRRMRRQYIANPPRTTAVIPVASPQTTDSENVSSEKETGSTTATDTSSNPSPISTDNTLFDGKYRIVLRGDTSNSFSGYSGNLTVINARAVFKLESPEEILFNPSMAIDSNGFLSGSISSKVNGQSTQLNFIKTQIKGNLLTGSYSITSANSSILRGSLSGTRQGYQTIQTANGAQKTQRIQVITEFDGVYLTEFRQDNGTLLKMCLTLSQGNLTGNSENQIKVEGSVGPQGQLIIMPASQTTAELSGDGVIQENGSITGGRFTIGSNKGLFSGQKTTNCSATNSSNTSTSTSTGGTNTATVTATSTGSTTTSTTTGGTNTATTTATNTGTSSQTSSNSDGSYALCSVPNVQDNPLVCRRASCGTTESSLLSDGRKGIQSFTNLDSCMSTCKDLAFQKDPNASSVEKLTGLGDRFADCQSTSSETNSTPETGLSGKAILCSQKGIGDHHLVCQSQEDGCKGSLIGGVVIDDDGVKNETAVFDSMNQCKETCKDLQFKEDPNASSLEKFTQIGSNFSRCLSLPENTQEEHVVCLKIDDSGANVVREEVYCKPKVEGCSDSPLIFQFLFGNQIVVTRVAKDQVYPDKESCQTRCSSLESQDILGDTSLPSGTENKTEEFFHACSE